MKTCSYILLGILVVLGLVCLTIGGNELRLFTKSKYGVRIADADREIYQHSKSYIRGKTSELAKSKYQYDKTEDDQNKLMLKVYITEEFADINSSDINNDSLRRFLMEIRGY